MNWYQDQKRCSSAARRVLKNCGVTAPPIDLEKIARELGAEVVVQTYENEALCGLLLRENHRRLISVNRAHALTRRRFTIAHEVGHLVLHQGDPVFMDKLVLVNLRETNKGEGNSHQEREANWFAAELLMPPDMVETVVRERIAQGAVGNLKQFVSMIAKRFGVSPEAMTYRLKNLGLLEL